MSVQDYPVPALNGGALRVVGLSKTYGSTQALRGLSLTAEPRQVIGVVGPNGAGKSTLVRILAGEEPEDAGTITVGGKAVSADDRGRLVAVVHQEPQLFPNLSVLENLMVDRQGLFRPKPTADIFELLEMLDIGNISNTPLEDTSIVVWQLTEIARALLRSAEVFLFDEPNSALTRDESEHLFQQMQTLCQAGKLVVLVSHRLAEVAEVCRRVFVVRDGRVVASLGGGEITSDRLSSLLTAEEFGAAGDDTDMVSATQDHAVRHPGPEHPTPGEAPSDTPDGRVAPPLAVTGVPGLVVAVTGPEGGGGRELVRSAAVPGELGADGERGGRAYMPADRRQCLFFNMSVAANISARLARSQLPGEKRLVTRGVLAQAASSYIEGFNIKAAHAGASVGSLSGGNQQKVALASALAVKPTLLIVEEPTRGVDIRTKLQIYEILRAFASSGGAVVMFVNELEDALGCADFLYVVNEGVVRGRVELKAGADLEEVSSAVNRMVSASHAA